jgi:hypothetical protein
LEKLQQLLLVPKLLLGNLFGDFEASYTKVDEGVEVSITVSNNFAVDDLDDKFKKKTIKLEFGEEEEETP